MNLVCGFFSPNFFSSGHFFGFPRQIVPQAFVVGGSALAIIRNLYTTTLATKDNVSHAYTSPLSMWAQFSAFALTSTLWFWETRDSLAGSDWILLLCTLGLLNAAQTVTIIVAHMARTKVPAMLNYVRLVPALLAVANARLHTVSDSQAVQMVFCAMAVHFLHYSASLSVQIATYLGVSTFKVGGPTCVNKRK